MPKGKSKEKSGASVRRGGGMLTLSEMEKIISKKASKGVMRELKKRRFIEENKTRSGRTLKSRAI